jgi:hypothetical protein
MAVDSESVVRGVIAAQTNLPASVGALVRYLTNVCDAAENGDHAALKVLTDSLQADPKAWYDAVFVNTEEAIVASGTVIPPTVGGGDEFTLPSERGEPPAVPKHEPPAHHGATTRATNKSS